MRRLKLDRADAANVAVSACWIVEDISGISAFTWGQKPSLPPINLPNHQTSSPAPTLDSTEGHNLVVENAGLLKV